MFFRILNKQKSPVNVKLIPAKNAAFRSTAFVMINLTANSDFYKFRPSIQVTPSFSG